MDMLWAASDLWVISLSEEKAEIVPFGSKWRVIADNDVIMVRYISALLAAYVLPLSRASLSTIWTLYSERVRI